MILGTSFRERPQYTFPSLLTRTIDAVRNVYMLVNYGDFVDGNTSNTAAPYLQFLSTTDPASAHADFLSVRLNQTIAFTPTPAEHAAIDTNASSTPSPKGVKSAFLKEKIPIIIVLSVGVALVILGVLLLMCTRNRLSRRGRDSLASTYRSYQHLNAPAPAGDMRPVSGYGYAQPQQPYAQPPWGRH